MQKAEDNARVEDRKSLFVHATLHFVDGFCSIKLRNISPTGALIEAERLPRSGTPVEIRRGKLVAVGTVIWRRGGKAGIEFLSETDVSRWMPAAPGPVVSDNAFQVFKDTPVPTFRAPGPKSRVTAEEMEGVAVLLDDLAATFAKDAGVQFNYAAKLQALGVASRLLRKLASNTIDQRRN